MPPSHDDENVQLHGGVDNSGAVTRVGAEVRRPMRSGRGTRLLFQHLRMHGFPAPRWLGVDGEGRERLTFVDGVVATPPFPDWVLTDAALESVVRLLSQYHTAASSFIAPMDAGWDSEFEYAVEGSIIGHNDVCPENVVFRHGEAFALIDFDQAAPTHPLLDLAHLARMWVPLGAGDVSTKSSEFQDHVSRRLAPRHRRSALG